MSYLAQFETHAGELQALSVGTYPDSNCDKGACEFHSEEAGDEGSFSWSNCDTCWSRLGGNRYAAHALIPLDKPKDPSRPLMGAEVLHLEVCTDCLIFIANGDLPEESA